MVQNLSSDTLADLVIQIPLPETLDDIRLPSEWERDGTIMQWQPGSIEPGEERTSQIDVQAPWLYGTLTLQNVLGRIDQSGVFVLAPVLRTEISGGVIPINVARTLTNQVVIVEGIATMYTDGLFAGSTGTKFYIDDGTAGAQVYVAGGMGVVNVPIGARRG